MNFEIHFVEPSKAELAEAAVNWYEPLKGLGPDEWPQELHDASTPTTFVTLDEADVEFIFDPLGERQTDLDRKIDDILNWKNAVPKLQTRSPKDAWGKSDPWSCSGRHIVSWLSASMRVQSDLCNLVNHPTVMPLLCLREPIQTFDEVGEFRCFVKDGDLIAVSAYDYTRQDQAKVVEKHAKTLRLAIEEFWKQRVGPYVEKENYIFDLVPGWTLLELNPYGLSDPCWFGSYANVEKASSYIQTTSPTSKPASESE